ncbi:uncharacterized protein BYT42DRAFT_611201 [Radiomyces spectabilis]|uniref:uncharacterized protein n=1 Tax=Radiomyces spectabilis TaxID=64574 RepID=UPI002220F920|nr:uncharacterized protein BYT42DRAFT_611201 [Radiomyces spectabilis]KAI8388132.1 hypothetical protein BYT42DRAFT_611201 [Radiomyces spectabilis]
MSIRNPVTDAGSTTKDMTAHLCDSPSESSTSEPHDDTTHMQQNNFIDQSFFYKLDQLAPDNPLFFMQQQQQQQQQNEQHKHFDQSQSHHAPQEEDDASHYEDQPMHDADTDVFMDFTSLNTEPPSSRLTLQQQQQQPPSTTENSSLAQSQPHSIADSLQQATSSSAPESSQTFWSGFNSFFSNVAHNPFPQAFPNLAKNFTEYLSTYPIPNVPHNPFPQAIPNLAKNFTEYFNYPMQLTSSLNPLFTQFSQAQNEQHTPLSELEYESPPDVPGGLPHSIKNKGMQIRVLGVPQTGAKSRVETQIKLCIQLVTDDGDKAQRWSHLKLPEQMVAKDKLKRQIMLTNSASNTKATNMVGLDSANMPIKSDKMLFLSARVICASDPSRKVVTCLGCIQRERKRSQRRKENKVKMETDDDRRLADDEKSLAQEEQKVLLFNCSDVVDFSSGDTILPTRITCYCRHHNEKVGFCIYFEMHDHTGDKIATGMSPPIMITDDHKSSKVKASRKHSHTEYEKPNKQTILSAGQFDFRAPASVHSTNSQLQSSGHTPSFATSFKDPRYPIPSRPTSSHPDITAQHTTNVKDTTTDTSMVPSMNFLSSIASGTTHSGSPLANERPQLQRLIPNEGPTYGGQEVTILGNNFRPGMTCLFGDVEASSTHYWSPNTLVCILPPAREPGTVVVSFKEHPMVMDSQEVTLFTYYSENDRALMELALQVVGLKMTGKVEDAREIAMRIVQGGGQNSNSPPPPPPSGQTRSLDPQPQQRQNCLERHINQAFEAVDPMNLFALLKEGL